MFIYINFYLIFIIIDFIINDNGVINGIAGLLLITIQSKFNYFTNYYTSYINNNNIYFELLIQIPSYLWIILYSSWCIFVFQWTKTCLTCHFHIILLLFIPFIRSIYKKRKDLWYTSYLFGITTMTIITTPFYKYFLNSNEIYYKKLKILYQNILIIWAILNLIFLFYFMVL